MVESSSLQHTPNRQIKLFGSDSQAASLSQIKSFYSPVFDLSGSKLLLNSSSNATNPRFDESTESSNSISNDDQGLCDDLLLIIFDTINEKALKEKVSCYDAFQTLFRAEEMGGEQGVNDLIQMTFDEFSEDEQITMQEFCMRFCLNIILVNRRYQ